MRLTFLLFLKMADEQSQPPFNKPSPVPAEFAWSTLLKPEGEALEVHYRRTLQELGARGGTLGTIFSKAQNKIQDPAKLRRLIADLIDKEQWSSLDSDAKNRAGRKESERFKCFDYEELVKRDKLNLDIFWLKDEALEASANLPPPDVIAADIAADLEAALEQFATIAEDLK